MPSNLNGLNSLNPYCVCECLKWFSVAFVRSVRETVCGLVVFLGIRNQGTSMKNKVPNLFVKKIIIINSLTRFYCFELSSAKPFFTRLFLKTTWISNRFSTLYHRL